MDRGRYFMRTHYTLADSHIILGLKPRSFCSSCGKNQEARPWSKPSRQKSSSSGRSYVLLVIPIATFGLGTWQVQRRSWKLGLIRDLEQMTVDPPVPLPENLDDIQDLEYRKLSVRGKFDHSKEVYIVPRAPVGEETKHGGLITGAPSKSGAYVVTAFQLADRDMRIMVNRGWVPRNKVNPATRANGQIAGEIDLIGVVRKTEKRPPFGAKNDPSHNQWHFRDQENMSKVLNTEPILIDAVQSTTVPDGPIGGQTRVTLRNEHFSYIITWYSLSAITFAGWYLRYWKGR